MRKRKGEEEERGEIGNGWKWKREEEEKGGTGIE